MAAAAPNLEVFKDIPKWIDTCLERLTLLFTRTDLCAPHVLHFTECIKILQTVQEIFMTESNLTECTAPIKVVGDLHAQFQEMNRLFDLIGRVPQEKLLFLGDYVDRGPQGIEILMYLFCLKIKHPDRIYILRGNHETPSVNKIYGFYNECAMKYGIGIWWDFMVCFNRIPMSGLISKKVLCMHGGLSPHLMSLDIIRRIDRPCEPLDSGILIDLLWSDPTNRGEGWFQSIRGISYMFGKGVCEQACNMLGIDLIIRAHQVVQDGYEVMCGRRLITVFSCANYCGQFTNAAAVVCLDGDLKISFQRMQFAAPPRAKPAPVIAAERDPIKQRDDKEYIKPFTGWAVKEEPPKSSKEEIKTANTDPPVSAPQQSPSATNTPTVIPAPPSNPTPDAGGATPPANPPA